jgi:hypothetical protein
LVSYVIQLSTSKKIQSDRRAYLDSCPIVTFPITEADGATKEASERVGATPSTATNRVDGTSFSVYFVTSILFPALSNADLKEERGKAHREKHVRGDIGTLQYKRS